MERAWKTFKLNETSEETKGQNMNTNNQKHFDIILDAAESHILLFSLFNTKFEYPFTAEKPNGGVRNLRSESDPPDLIDVTSEVGAEKGRLMHVTSAMRAGMQSNAHFMILLF